MIRRAFTLLELVLVMVVLSVLAGISLPRITGSLAYGRLQDQARALVSLSRKAKALASAEGRTYVVVVDPEQKQLKLRRQRDPMQESTDAEEPELDMDANAMWSRPVAFSDGVTLREVEQNDEVVADVNAESLKIEFRQDGTADRTRIVLQGKGDDTLVVTVDPNLGVARIEEEEDQK